MNARVTGRPPVVVLSFGGTGLATVRCLARGGMTIHAAIFPSAPAGLEVRRSRHCRTISLGFPPDDEEALFRWLDGFSRSLDQPPVVFPTSDGTALFLARHGQRLSGVCTTWQTDPEELRAIVGKDGLYRTAQAAGVRVPPMIVEPAPAEVEAWCKESPPPYFMKPFYASIGGCALKSKNRLFHSAADLIEYSKTTSLRNILVQRRIDCGDGHVYDAYGLCGRRGELLALASHRRIRQHPPGTGSTSHGEIPITGNPDLERAIFHETMKLLSRVRYHGIFGIEWLHEKGTGALYLADFNARPFSSIGHLADAGLNLPLLAYHELLGHEPPADLHPSLRHSTWTDFNRDLRSFREARREHGQSWVDFTASILRCRSFAYFDARDPGPWLSRTAGLLRMLAGHVARRKGRSKVTSPSSSPRGSASEPPR